MNSISLREIIFIICGYCCCTVDSAWRSFETEPQNTTVIEGSSVVLNCKVLPGYTDYPVYWEINGNVLIPGTTETERYKWIEDKNRDIHNLQILNASKDDEGFYVCVLHFVGSEYSIEERSRPAMLNVIRRPIFIEEPQNKTVTEGRNVTMNCQVANLTERRFNVFWMKTDVGVLSKNHLINRLPGITNSSRYSVPHIGYNNYNFKITKVFLEDAGDFQCMVSLTNSSDYVLKSRPATLSVLLDVNCSVESPNPNKQFYQEGDDITTACSITRHRARSDVPVILSWLKTGMEFDGTNVDVMNLHIRDSWSLTANDDSTYIACKIQLINSSRVSLCQIGPIRVHYAPIVTVVPFNPVVLLGEKLTLTCSSRANPDAINYRWFLNDMVISDTDNSFEVEQGGQTLTIRAITEIYSGVKVGCTARNAVATRNGSTRILVWTFDNTTVLISLPSVVVIVVLVVIIVVMGGVICYCYRSLKRSRREVKTILQMSPHPTHRDISSTIATNPGDDKSHASDLTDDPESQYAKLDSVNLQTTYTNLIAHKSQGCSETTIGSASQEQEEVDYEQVDEKRSGENSPSDCSDNLS